MLSIKRNATLGLLAGLAGTAVSSSASAQTTPESTVVLNTATTLAYHAPNRANTKPRQRDCPGIVDPAITFDRKTLDIFAFTTYSVPWGNGTNLDTGCQGAMVISKLTATGLATPQFIPMPNEGNAQRVRQRMNALLGKNFVAAVFADEVNATNDGNPSTVMYVYDRTGKPLPITNAGDVGQKPTDAIDLYALSGKDDGEQFSGHDQVQLPDEADGSQSWVIVAQWNNQKAKAFKVNIATDGVTGAKVTVPWGPTTLIQNAQHVRPVLAVPTDGVAHNNSLIIAGVDANGQPKTNGVRADQFSTVDGHVMSSTLFPSEKSNGIYYVQPSIAYVNDNVVALHFQRAQPNAAKEFNVNRNDGHEAQPDLSRLITLKVPTSEGADFTAIQQLDGVALQNRHSASFALNYGAAGSESGGIGVLSAASTGTGGGFMQVLPIRADGTYDPPDSLKSYQVAEYADVSGLAAATLRDPGQARAFFKSVYGLPNPSYQNKAGFMPEVKTFSIAAVAGYANMSTDNMESLTFALVPAVWDPAYNTTPGTPVANVPPGPSPTAPTGTPTTNPSGPSNGGTAGMPGTGTSSGGTVGGTTGGTGGSGGGIHAPGYGGGTSASNGCGCTTAGADQTSGLAGFATLGLGFAFLGLRRRGSNKKES
jgi:MYXO-CTERM domain-containing protein